MSGITIPFGRRLAIGISSVLLFLLIVLCALALPVLLVWPLWILGAIGLAALLVAGLIHLVRRLLARSGNPPGLAAFAGTAAIVFMSLSAAAAFPIYFFAYLVDARPTVMPLATLSDGRKTVQFQGMQHIGAELFYKGVVYDLETALTEDYVLFYEGVQPVDGRPELTTWFDSLITGGTDLSDSYRKLAESCGMTFQLEYFKTLLPDMKARPERHVTADVTYLDLKSEYDRLVAEDAEFAAAVETDNAETSADSNDEGLLAGYFSLVEAGTPEQKRLLGLMCRGFFSYGFSQKKAPRALDRVILDYRNTRLARMIADAPQDKVYVTYGAAHLPGVIAELQKIDPQWEVLTVRWSRAIANPEEYQGVIE